MDRPSREKDDQALNLDSIDTFLPHAIEDWTVYEDSSTILVGGRFVNTISYIHLYQKYVKYFFSSGRISVINIFKRDIEVMFIVSSQQSNNIIKIELFRDRKVRNYVIIVNLFIYNFSIGNVKVAAVLTAEAKMYLIDLKTKQIVHNILEKIQVRYFFQCCK